MKVGILSMQRIHNYGSFLQAFALKKTIEALGNECQFLDIKPGIHLPCHNSAKNVDSENKIVSRLKKIDKHLLNHIENYFYRKKYEKKHENEFFKILGLSARPCYDKKFNVVVIGSDEVFNCLANSPWGFSEQLFGKGINADKIISYAGSFGFTSFEDLVNNNLGEDIKLALTNLSEVSVRDQNSYDIISKLTGIPPVKHLDPVFIFDFTEWIPDTIEYKDYILIYAYQNRINDPEEIKAIRNFAKKYNKKIIAVGMYQLFCDKNILVSPFELLRFVKNADYVITDTFHGTVFSIKYNKRFCTFIRKTNSEKISEILNTFGLLDRGIKDTNVLEKVLNTPTNHKAINDNIEYQKGETLKYLRKHLT